MLNIPPHLRKLSFSLYDDISTELCPVCNALGTNYGVLNELQIHNGGIDKCRMSLVVLWILLYNTGAE